ncbi:MAG: bifunctional oligoribonuclease/PAP phosphatase NrnA [Planctomycetota bacterium]
MLDILRTHSRFLLTGHLRADGDCLGAEGVLYHALAGMGKKVWVINPDPPDGRYGFLQEHFPFSIYRDEEDLPEFDVLLVCDCSSLGRLGPMGKKVSRRPAKRIAVDHHPMEGEDSGFWDVLFHDTEAPATGILALELARKLGGKLPLPALEAAFISLASDTGWFRYSSAGRKAWMAAAELVAMGVSPEALYRRIYQFRDPGAPRGLSAALGTLQYERDGRVALAWLSQELLDRSGGSLGDVEEVLDVLRSVEEVELAAYLLEQEDGRVKASLRSKTDRIDVNRIARNLGGGGHAQAAGVTFPEETPLVEARSLLRKELLAAYDASLDPDGS